MINAIVVPHGEGGVPVYGFRLCDCLLPPPKLCWTSPFPFSIKVTLRFHRHSFLRPLALYAAAGDCLGEASLSCNPDIKLRCCQRRWVST